MSAKASQMAYSYACSMFWNPRSFSFICMLLIRLYTPKHVVFLMPLSFEDVKELFVYILLWGLYLSGFII